METDVATANGEPARTTANRNPRVCHHGDRNGDSQWEPTKTRCHGDRNENSQKESVCS